MFTDVLARDLGDALFVLFKIRARCSTDMVNNFTGASSLSRDGLRFHHAVDGCIVGTNDEQSVVDGTDDNVTWTKDSIIC